MKYIPAGNPDKETIPLEKSTGFLCPINVVR